MAIGKVGEKEIDFIATKMNEKKYIQVTDNMNAPETRARELAPLQAVQDNYEKIVIAMDCDLISDVDDSTENIITLVTCVMNQPDYRWCVQAREK